MTVERINATDYANIYGVYEDSGKPIGTAEVRIAGRDVGIYFYTLSGKYTRKDIERIFIQERLKEHESASSCRRDRQ